MKKKVRKEGERKERKGKEGGKKKEKGRKRRNEEKKISCLLGCYVRFCLS